MGTTPIETASRRELLVTSCILLAQLTERSLAQGELIMELAQSTQDALAKLDAQVTALTDLTNGIPAKINGAFAAKDALIKTLQTQLAAAQATDAQDTQTIANDQQNVANLQALASSATNELNAHLEQTTEAIDTTSKTLDDTITAASKEPADATAATQPQALTPESPLVNVAPPETDQSLGS